MAVMVDEDYALALRLQEEFDRESEVGVRDVNAGVWDDKWQSSGVESESLATKLPVPSSVIDLSWELIDPNPDARALFLEFNDKYFWGKLGGVEVRWSPRMTLCAGVCVYEGRGGMCSIRLSEPLLKLRPRKDLVETLLHEMIHAYLFVTDNDRDRDGHGPRFLKHMHRLNKATGAHITVYHSFHDEVDNYRTHWWRCSGPCQNRKPYFGYVKRAMNRPPSSRDPWWPDHQRTCGGTFTKIKEPEDYGAKKNKRTQQEKIETSVNSDKKNLLAGWLQMASTQPNSSRSGQSSESVAKGSGFLTNGNTKTSSVVTAGAPDVINIDFISDDELMVAVDKLEKNLVATQQMELENNGECWNVPDETNFTSAACSGNSDLLDAGEVLSVSPTRSKLPEIFLNKPDFPGKGIVLGQKPSTNQLPSSSSSGQVLRRLPGIGLLEVRADVPRDKGVGAEIRNLKDVGELVTQVTSNVESDELSSLSRKLSLNNKSCTIEDQSKLNILLSKDAEHTTVDNRKPSNVSTNRSRKVQENLGASFHKATTDIRFWLSDPSREVGEVVRVPNFTSVSNPNFRKVKEEREKALPSLKIPRQWEDDHNIRPAKKIRLDNKLDFEMAAASDRHINSSETKKTVNGACDKGKNVDNNRGKLLDNNRRMIVDNGRGMNVDNSQTAIVGNDRVDSLDHCSVMNTDCITLCSDDSDVDESQTIASVISRIRASVSIDNVTSIRQDGSSYSQEITPVEPLQVADAFSSSVIPENSPDHMDSGLPNHAPCPVCGLLVDVATINEHLDLCLS